MNKATANKRQQLKRCPGLPLDASTLFDPTLTLWKLARSTAPPSSPASKSSADDNDGKDDIDDVECKANGASPFFFFVRAAQREKEVGKAGRVKSGRTHTHMHTIVTGADCRTELHL